MVSARLMELITVSPAERRAQPRLGGHFTARVCGRDLSGERFRVETVADNISAGGLFLRMPGRVALGASLFVLVSFSTLVPAGQSAPRVAARGRVVRAERQQDGRCGVAVRFTSCRLLDPRPGW